jgi:hypothetical protein
LTQLARKYSSQGAQFIGITDEDRAKVDRFVAQMGNKMDYTVAIDSDGTAQEYMQRYHIQGIPHAFIVNRYASKLAYSDLQSSSDLILTYRMGKIVWNGHPMDPAFESSLSSALAEKGASAPSTLTEAAIKAMNATELKSLLESHNINTSDCLEKSDLLAKAVALTKR